MTGDEEVSRSQSNAKSVACETERRTWYNGVSPEITQVRIPED
jgi:hypothetical protein